MIAADRMQGVLRRIKKFEKTPPLFVWVGMKAKNLSGTAYLEQLTEKIAENVHEVWAKERIQEGWTCGAVRDDAKKETPCLVPYACLPENEKDYDHHGNPQGDFIAGL